MLRNLGYLEENVMNKLEKKMRDDSNKSNKG